MDNWLLLPRPERVTELYFTDYRQLPESAAPGTAQTVHFTVTNLEHRATAYRYTLTVMSEDDMVEHPVDTGSFTLSHNRSFAASGVATLPAAGERAAVRVNLQYEGIGFGDSTPSVQKQTIHYWTAMTGSGHDEGNDEEA